MDEKVSAWFWPIPERWQKSGFAIYVYETIFLSPFGGTIFKIRGLRFLLLFRGC